MSLRGRVSMLHIVLSLMSCGAVPNIVVIIADDLGWNDVGFHGSNQIPTPNLDALAYSGIILQNHYVLPICTPSRAALMTGKYPIHNGMQHGVIYGTQKIGLPLTEKLLPEYLKELGYKTHLIGKWHLGHYKSAYLPLQRGFDSFFGHWTGKIDLFEHTNIERPHVWGFDFRRGFSVAHDWYGTYATDVYTQETIKVIEAHNKSEPLFLMISHSAVHSGNPHDPLRAPDHVVAHFNITDRNRRKFAGMLSKLDESVGKVIKSLETQNLLENSIILFTSDNGGPAAGFNSNAASNFPFRGVKNTLWEGGIRGASFLWSPLLEKKSRVARQRTHIVDWLPTLYSAAGGNVSVFKDIDGIDQWESLSKDTQSNRNLLVHNIDDIFGSASITLGPWKIHKGTTYNGTWDLWYGPGGRIGDYDMELLNEELSAQALDKLGMMPNSEVILQLRNEATIKCNASALATPCKPLQAPCLFNIELDPCEYRNLADYEPDVLKKMLEELDKVNKTAVPPQTAPQVYVPGNPKLWGWSFTNFGDYETNLS